MFLTIRKDRQMVSVDGIAQPESDLLKLTDDYLVIKVPGHNYTTNMRPGIHTEYIPVEIQVWKIYRKTDHGEIIAINAEKVLNFGTKKSKLPY